ncbi:MAG: DUF1353 domain-containing protein [Hyphomonadaceae bacterium]
MTDNKQRIGRTLEAGERDLINGISEAMEAVATGRETAFVDRESFGADQLFARETDGFVSALAILLIPKELKDKSRRIAAVSQPFGFVVALSNKKRLSVVAPSGYVTDFASIPRLVQWVISPFGRHAEAAVIHDWLYALGQKGDWGNRRIADKAFVKALRLLQVGWLKRQVMYWAVRLGGAGGYGLKGDFVFRKLDDLTIVDPTPDREPYRSSWATCELSREQWKALRQANLALRRGR